MRRRHPRVLSCISYKKYTRKPAHGLPTAPSPELSADTQDCVIPNAVRDLLRSLVAILLGMKGLFCHPERSEGSYRRAVGNGPYKAVTHVSPRRGGSLPPAVRINTDPAAIVGSFVALLLGMTGLGCHLPVSSRRPVTARSTPKARRSHPTGSHPASKAPAAAPAMPPRTQSLHAAGSMSPCRR